MINTFGQILKSRSDVQVWPIRNMVQEAFVIITQARKLEVLALQQNIFFNGSRLVFLGFKMATHYILHIMKKLTGESVITLL